MSNMPILYSYRPMSVWVVPKLLYTEYLPIILIYLIIIY